MSERSRQLHASADQQLGRLLALIPKLDESTARRACPGREKLGDGTIGAVALHTVANYERIAAFVNDGSGAVAQAGAAGDHRDHRRGGERHAAPIAANGFDAHALTETLRNARIGLAEIGGFTDAQLDRVPADGSFRFCNGQRTLEQVLAGLLAHQQHQLHALEAAVSSGAAARG